MVKRRFSQISDSPKIFDSPIISDKVSDRVSDKISDRVSDKISDRISDRVSDRVSDRISDRVFDKKFDSPKFTWNTFKSLYRVYKFTKKVKKYLAIIDVKKPQPVLEPIIGNIYGSPPIDPRDCGLYPDSPFCGGFPISDSFFSTQLSIVKDKCNTGIELGVTLGFIKMPPVQVVYRNPECKIELPPELPDENYTSMPDIPLQEADFYIISSNEIASGQGGRRNTLPQACTETFVDKIIHNLSYSPNTGFSYDIEFYQEFTFNGTYVEAFWNLEVLQQWLAKDTTIKNQGQSPLSYDTSYKSITRDRKTGTTWRARDVPFVNVVEGGRQNLINYLNANTYIRNTFTIVREDIVVYSYDSKFFPLKIPGKYPGTIEITGKGEDFYGNYYYGVGRNLQIATFQAKISIFPIGYPKPQLEEPLPPPPPPMSCCPNVRENDELLRLIAKRLGAYDYPVNVPRDLTDRSRGIESIENLTRLHTWSARQLDALCGKYPVEIEIEDADLTKDGNQTKNVVIPNIAEGMAELLGMSLQIQSETSAILNAAVRTLIECSNTKQIAIIGHDYSKANAEFLGYKGQQEVRKTPFMCTPGKERLDEVLDESEIEIKGWENVDDQDIKDLLAPLLDMAAMYRVQNFRNLGTKNTLANLTKTLTNPQLVNLVGNLIKNERLKKYNEKSPENQNPEELKEIIENEFDKFVEEAENGFIAKAGIKDNTNPYGRPYDERPRIREIGITTGENINGTS